MKNLKIVRQTDTVRKKEAVHVVVQLRKQYKECFKLQWRRAVWADTGGL